MTRAARYCCRRCGFYHSTRRISRRTTMPFDDAHRQVLIFDGWLARSYYYAEAMIQPAHATISRALFSFSTPGATRQHTGRCYHYRAFSYRRICDAATSRYRRCRYRGRPHDGRELSLLISPPLVMGKLSCGRIIRRAAPPLLSANFFTYGTFPPQSQTREI